MPSRKQPGPRRRTSLALTLNKRARVVLGGQHRLRPNAGAALLSLAMVVAIPQLIAPRG